LEAEISANGSSSYCWWWCCCNNGCEGTSPHSLPRMNSYGLRSMTESATNSKYLRLCTQCSVSLSSYTGCVECRAVCCKQFPLEKKELLQVVPVKIDIFVTRKRGSEKLLKNRCTLIINFSSLLFLVCPPLPKKNKYPKCASSKREPLIYSLSMMIITLSRIRLSNFSLIWTLHNRWPPQDSHQHSSALLWIFPHIRKLSSYS
jgi:hypothetical protein